MTNELYHYGILGMKWGVRRYQNSDGSLTEEGKKRYSYGRDYDKELVLKKGSSFSRISFTSNETHTGRTYGSFKDSDIEQYITIGKKLVDMFGGEEYKYDFIVKNDLKIPSRKEMVDSYLDLVRINDPDATILSKGRVAQEKAFDKFGYDMVKRNERSDEYFAFMMAKGYDAVLDVADMKKGISEVPILVFDREKSLNLKSINRIY